MFERTVCRVAEALGAPRRKESGSGAMPAYAPRRPARRALAGALAACLLLTLLPVSAMAAEGGEAQVSMQTLIDNVPERCGPHLVRTDNGTQVLFFLNAAAGRTGYNAQALYYSIYDNGIWGSPKLVSDDGTADATPFAAAYGDEIHILWSNGKTVLGEGATLLDALKNMNRIWHAVLDVSGGSDPTLTVDEGGAISDSDTLYLNLTMSFRTEAVMFGGLYAQCIDLKDVSAVDDADRFVASQGRMVPNRWLRTTGIWTSGSRLFVDGAYLICLDFSQGIVMERGSEEQGDSREATHAALYTQDTDGDLSTAEQVCLYLQNIKGTLSTPVHCVDPIPLTVSGDCSSPRVLAQGDALVLTWIEGGGTLCCADLRPVIAALKAENADATGTDLYNAVTTNPPEIFTMQFPDSLGEPMTIQDCRPVLGEDGKVYIFFSGLDSGTGCQELYAALCLSDEGPDAPAGLSGAVRVARLAEKDGSPWALDEAGALVDKSSNVMAVGNLHPAGTDGTHKLVSVDHTSAFSPKASVALEDPAVGAGEENAVLVTVANQGLLPGGNLAVKADLGGTEIGSEITGVALRGGERKTLRFPWTPGEEDILADSLTFTGTVTESGKAPDTAALTLYRLAVTDGSGSGHYAAGTEVTVTAETKANKRFKEWTATGISLTDATESPVTITMPGEAVTLTATYEDVYTISFDAGGGSVTPATAQTGAGGKLDSLPTPTRSGNYSFDCWQLSDETRVTLDTVFTEDTTITAHWTYTGGGASSDGSHTTTVKNPDGSTTTTVTESNGTKTETTKTPDGTKRETVTTPQGDRTYTEQRPDGMKISADAPKNGEATAKVTLPENAGQTVISFPAANGTVVLRVLPDGAEEPVPFSLLDDGMVYVRLDGDAELRVETRAGLFDDMGGHWAEQSADFTGARELFEGTAPRNFAPEETMTRAMLTMVLYRMDGKPQVGEAAFDDVDAAAWYAPGAAWASEHGIAAGNEGAFDGGRAITRQELAFMLWNFAKYIGLDVSTDGDKSSYPDMNEAAEWAVPALEWACGMGILQGDQNGALHPTGTATRAEVATMLQRFVIAVVQ